MPALVDFMAGLIMREGTTFLIRIATSWPMPTFRPEAVADIHSPTGTKLKNGMIAKVGSGSFIWPVPNYRYCSRWYGGRHRGVDICAPAGTPIYASAGGTITKAGYNKAGAGTGYGYSVIINHGGGYSSVYAHCLSLTVSAGQTVKQGQLIGYVGSTGRSTGNHCHFEIRLNGSYIPPQNVFPGRK